MSDTTGSSGTVHWIGTGLSTGSGLRAVCDLAPRVLLWARTTQKAHRCLERLDLSGRADIRTFDPEALASSVAEGDVVVSMLPATEHIGLLRLCVKRRAHFACTSYVSEEILGEVPAAEKAGIVVLTEAGLDPGLDHVLARLLVGEARAVLGDVPAAVRFHSYCGGIPAVPNDFRYRFSWAPRGVLTALLSPARYVEGGEERLVAHPWTATRPLTIGGETFEVYPNRDSLPFVEQYGFPASWTPDTFVRGTLRLDGWRRAWEPVFAELVDGDPERISALAAELAARYPTTEQDRDRVVLAVTLSARAEDGRSWSGRYWLDVVGDDEDSAMARCVSLPLAFGIGEILDGSMPAGLRRAAESHDEARRWVDFCGRHGIEVVGRG